MNSRDHCKNKQQGTDLLHYSCCESSWILLLPFNFFVLIRVCQVFHTRYEAEEVWRATFTTCYNGVTQPWSGSCENWNSQTNVVTQIVQPGVSGGISSTDQPRRQRSEVLGSCFGLQHCKANGPQVLWKDFLSYNYPALCGWNRISGHEPGKVQRIIQKFCHWRLQHMMLQLSETS